MKINELSFQELRFLQVKKLGKEHQIKPKEKRINIKAETNEMKSQHKKTEA